MNNGMIVKSLEITAERCADLTPLVYARLFAEHPELEAHFIMDRDYAVRGSMLSWTLAALLDIADQDQFGGNLIETEATHHAGYDVPQETFRLFLGIVARSVQEVVGSDWTQPMADAWRELLTRLDRRIVETP